MGDHSDTGKVCLNDNETHTRPTHRNLHLHHLHPPHLPGVTYKAWINAAAVESKWAAVIDTNWSCAELCLFIVHCVKSMLVRCASQLSQNLFKGDIVRFSCEANRMTHKTERIF